MLCAACILLRKQGLWRCCFIGHQLLLEVPLKPLKLILDTFSLCHLHFKTATTRKRFRHLTFFFSFLFFFFFFSSKQAWFLFQFSDVSHWIVRRNSEIEIDGDFLGLPQPASVAVMQHTYVTCKNKTGRHVSEYICACLLWIVMHKKRVAALPQRKRSAEDCTGPPAFSGLKPEWFAQPLHKIHIHRSSQLPLYFT